MLQAFAAHPALLPDRIVCVLNGQRGQRIGFAVAQGRVQRQQFAGQHAHRPAVGDDVVHGQQQHVTFVLQLQQAATYQRSARQVERCCGLAHHAFGQRFRAKAQVFDVQQRAARQLGKKHLGALFAGNKAAAQGFVALDDPRQRGGQRVHIQRATKAQSQRDVVRLAAAFELGQEPQALLGKRQRQRLVTRRRQDQRQLAASGTGQRGSNGCQFTQRKEFTQWQFHAQLLANLRNHAHGQQGMPAHVEKVIVAADPLDLQHFGPDLRQGDFNVTLRWFVGKPQQRRVVRFRQCAAVQLAIGGQRQRGQLDEGHRDHVIGQVGLHVRTHLFRRGCFDVLLAGEIGDQAHIARFVFAGQHHRLPDPRQLVQAIDDFAQFDTKTTDLDLIVVAPQALQLPVFQPAPQIARAVHHGAGLIAERVGNKLLDGQLRAVQIPQCNAVATDVQLADHTQRREALLSVQHVNPSVANGSADRHCFGAACQRPNIVSSREGSGLGRAVTVQQMQARRLGQHCPKADRVSAFAT
ncbi:Uncharacterized protein AC506_2554 [Pseudomonas syringae pv. maculicola str. M6]|nr:Uncharacterized protein AC506_2554 [Pseudomonas syringae pv. maculicola str. M6]